MVVEFKDNNCFSGVKDVFIRDENKLLKIFYRANEIHILTYLEVIVKLKMVFLRLFLISNNMKKFINILNNL